jgi:DNA-binding NtrC family response regulator
MRIFDPKLSYRENRAAAVAAFEREYVEWLLAVHGGNISAASRAALMDRKYLHDIAKRHGLRGNAKGTSK